MINFITLPVLNEEQKKEIMKLVAVCREKEPVSLSFPMKLENFNGSPDGYCLAYEEEDLVSALALLMMDKRVCECIGFTHPEYRRRGLFSFMMEEAEKRLEVFSDMEIIAAIDQKSRDAEEALKALEWEFWYTEYMMTKELAIDLEYPTAIPYEGIHVVWEKMNSEKEEETFMFHCILGKESIGSCNISFSGDESYLFSLGIEEKYRSQGCGGYFLMKVLNILKDRKILRTKLQVSSQNEIAVKLYKKLDFQITEALDYYIW